MMDTIRLVRMALSAALCGLAGLGFVQVFSLRDLAVPVAAATIGAFAVSLAASYLPTRRLVMPVASGLALLIVGTGVVLHGAPGGPLVGLWDGFVDGWARILSTTVPAGNDPVMLFVPFVVTWVSASIACEVALDSTSVFAPVIPAAVVAVVARSFGGAANRPTGLIDPFFLIAAVLLGALGITRHSAPRHDRNDDPATDRASGAVARRRVATGMALAVVLASAAVVATPHIPVVASRQAVVLRDHWTAPITHPNASNPLDDLPGFLLKQRTTPEFSADTSAPVTYWQLLTLDTFDGASWSTSAPFLAAGSEVDDVTSAAARETTVHQRITVDKLSGIWLPTAAVASNLGFLSGSRGIAVDPSSGSFGLRTGELEPQVSYDAVSTVGAPSAAEEKSASLQGVPLVLRTDAELTPAEAQQAPQLSAVASAAMAGATTPWDQLVQLQDYLDGSEPTQNGIKFVLDPQATSGQSLHRIITFLTDTKIGGVGTSEQFATAFALIARSQGFPTRVAVGFKTTSATMRRGNGWKYVVTGGDAYAWPEVYLGNLGWTIFDPTPQVVQNRSVLATPQAPKPTIPPPAAPSPTKSPSTTTCANPLLQRCGGGGTHGSGPDFLLWLSLGVLVVVSVALSPLALKSIRGRRRRRGAPGDRILGAWSEAMDRLREAGVQPQTAMSSTEVVSKAGSVLGSAVAAPLKSLGDLRTGALFGPLHMSGADADHAWEFLNRFKKALTSSAAKPCRILRRLDPRPLSRLAP